MQTEDYVYQDDFTAGKLPLSKKHILAISLTAFVACSTYVLIPSNTQTVAHTNTAPIYTQDQDDYEEILDPTRSLTDVLLTGTTEVPATSRDVSQSSNNNNQVVYTTTDTASLENYDDDGGELEAVLTATAESELDDHLNELVASSGETKRVDDWVTEEIQRGDTLSSIFSDFNIPYNVLQSIASSKEAGSSLTNLRPGNKLYFSFDKKNNLVGFIKQVNGDEQLRFTRKDVSSLDFNVVREPSGSHIMIASSDGTVKPLVSEDNLPAYKTRGRLVVATIGSGDSFSGAAHDAGLTYSEIRQITDLFKGRVQFTRHIQPGDTVRVLFSDDKGEGKINAIELKLKKVGTLSAYRNLVDDRYYDERGYNSASSTFRRFPIDGKVVISSHFNPNRRHPVTGQYRPHNGTDFAVKVGTPIVAPADGVVELAKYSRTAGYYIILRHRGNYSTVYMHLSKIGVKVGDRVKIGQVIARSGNTGRSTGPHLHYELRHNGRAINAMRVSLPANEDVSIAKKNRQRFANNVALFKKELYQESLIAKNDTQVATSKEATVAKADISIN